VPGHPIAGSEKSGYQAANPDLFAGRKSILTPLPQNNTVAVAEVNRLWRILGAEVLGMSPSRHDEVLAATSHLPHLLAYAIVDLLLHQDSSEDIFRYAAGGFADFSRVASSNAQMWSDVFVANADATEKVLDQYIDYLQSLKALINQRAGEDLRNIFQRAKQTRDNFVLRLLNPAQAMVMKNTSSSYRISPGGSVTGTIRVPGDKSISHRSVIFGALAKGVTKVTGFLEGEDAMNTVAAFREMGVTITGPENGELTIFGVGMQGLQPPRKPLYTGNSGTAMRLLAGLLAAQPFDSELTGDESLSGRPMERIVKPLGQMGASIEMSAGGTPPLRIAGADLVGLSYDMPVASAQVKSSLLLAGLFAEGKISVTEPAICRDHTERMLRGFGYELEGGYPEAEVTLFGGGSLQATSIDVPADISSAAFFLVAAAITPGSELTLQHVGVNPTRTGIIELLGQMGAEIELSNEKEVGGEPVADLTVRYSPLQGIEIDPALVPLAIDEFPVLFVAAACANGCTVLRGAEELRVKESDRIEAMAEGLKTLGIDLETFADGIRIEGGTGLGGGTIDSHGDHRIAMAFAVAGLRASGEIEILNCQNVATSFPGFVSQAIEIGLKIEELSN
jgi:3-phosphoshikimate 1-carboxyvinyltransferase